MQPPQRRKRVPPAAAQGGPLSSSLIPQTLEELESDVELQELHARVAAEGQAALTREEAARRRRSLEGLGLPSFAAACAGGAAALRRGPTRILQLNIGLYCNQACRHCHVESSPLRKEEVMGAEVAARCAELMTTSPSLTTVDLTGGAPELCPQFRYLVGAARAAGLEVIDRCNLTVLSEPGQEDLPAFLAQNGVRVVASLPCYTAGTVDAQRGGGVFSRSIAGLQALNAAGYGVPGSNLRLDLVYNPGGAFLAPAAAALESLYRTELQEAHGISFTSLLCLNNMPIKRFADDLVKKGELDAYMQLLVESFNPAALDGLMCRDTVSVGWDGRLYDCDFNQQLELGLGLDRGAAGRTVFGVGTLEELESAAIAVDSHCFGCTAGSGSGCQGATAGN